ncbi:MAG: hypothetical protein ABH952_11225 [Candidatus Omnitrophota bacterium]
MKLNLKINDYSIDLGQELNRAILKKHTFKKIRFFDKLLIKPAKDQIVWWAKNCGMKDINE